MRSIQIIWAWALEEGFKATPWSVDAFWIEQLFVQQTHDYTKIFCVPCTYDDVHAADPQKPSILDVNLAEPDSFEEVKAFVEEHKNCPGVAKDVRLACKEDSHDTPI